MLKIAEKEVETLLAKLHQKKTEAIINGDSFKYISLKDWIQKIESERIKLNSLEKEFKEEVNIFNKLYEQAKKATYYKRKNVVGNIDIHLNTFPHFSLN